MELHRAKKVVATMNAGMISGFKTGQCNIEDLSFPLHEKYFTVNKPTDA
jgi:hypothetical protein